jgi:hypothetical protein
LNELDAWVVAACAELGLQPSDVQSKAVLDVARDVAHQVLRPAAPVSAYLMGVAVGRGADPSDVADRLSALALAWPNRSAEAESSHHQAEAERPHPQAEAESSHRQAEAESSHRPADAVRVDRPAGGARNDLIGVEDPPLP